MLKFLSIVVAICMLFTFTGHTGASDTVFYVDVPPMPAPPEKPTPTPMPSPSPAATLDPDAKRIALTFDDGPHGAYTPQVLDILKEYGAKATFFIYAEHVANNESVLVRIRDEGHEIASHTYCHPNLKKLSANEIRAELQHANDVIYSACGVTPTLLRPPYGAANDQVRDICSQMGLAIVLWSVDTEDWNNKDAQKIFDHTLAAVKDGSVLLMHDRFSSTVEGLKLVLAELSVQGYAFVTVTELFGQTEAGVTYRRLKR